MNRIGDTAVALLKAGAETDKKDVDGKLPLELAPDSSVSSDHCKTANRGRILTIVGAKIYLSSSRARRYRFIVRKAITPQTNR